MKVKEALIIMISFGTFIVLLLTLVVMIVTAICPNK